MTKTFFGYIRVSTKRQGEGASLPEQKSAIEAFAARHDLTISKWFCETRTAGKTGRREFDQMLRELKRGGATGLLVHKIDRSARNARDWVDVCDLIDRGIEVRFAHDDLDLTTRAGRLTADLLAAIAADFLRNNREQVKLCMLGWVKQGFYPWPPPLGYLKAGRHELKPIDPERGPLVRKAYELYASGAYSLETLRLELARRGLRGLDGHPLPRNKIARMLRRPFYTGMIQVGGQLYEGKHQPLVSQKLFDQVQALLDGRVFTKTGPQELVFRRLIRCAACPRTLTGERHKGRVYYRCHSRSCPGVSISEAEIEAGTVQPALDRLHLDEEELRDVRDLATALEAQEQREGETRIAMLDRDLANLGGRLQRLTDAVVDGLLDQETFAERRAALLRERNRLTEAKEAAKPSRFWENVLSWFERGNTASILYSRANSDEKRKTLLALGSNFTADGKRIAFSMGFPLDEIARCRSRLSSAPTRTDVRTRRQSRDELQALLLSLSNVQFHCPDPQLAVPLPPPL